MTPTKQGHAKRLHPSDERGVRRLIDCLVGGRKPTPSTLRWPNCGVVPGWLVIPAQNRAWHVRTPIEGGMTETINDEELIRLLKSLWLPLAIDRLAANKGKRDVRT